MYKKTFASGILVLFFVCTVQGCASSSENARSDEQNVHTGDKQAAATPVKQDSAGKIDEAWLVGTVIKKPWSKSTESWNAGGSEYYVLDVGDTEVKERSAKEGVILRPSDTVSEQNFDALVGKKVKITGVYVEAKPYTPQHPGEQYPMGMDNKPLPRGSGFQVLNVEEK